MENNQNIPKHWEVKKLGEVCTYSKGKKPKVLSTETGDTINIPYINIKAFEKGIFDEYTDGEKCNLCEDGDLLMVWDGARAGFTGKAKRGAVGSTLMKIEPKDGVLKNYLFYFLLSLYKKLNTNPRGVGIPHVEPSLLWNSGLIIPPPPEQKSIVSKIEELFSELDNSVAQLKLAQQQLKTYRQSVLKAAFEGKLTQEWRKSAPLSGRRGAKGEADEQDLLIAAEPEVEYQTKNKLPERWRWVKLGDVIEKPKYGTSKKCRADEKGIGVLRIPNIVNGRVNQSDLKFAEFEKDEIETYSLKEGDILTIRSNGSVDIVGQCALVTKKDEQFLYAGYLIRLRPIFGIANPKFLLNVLSSHDLRVQIEETARSTSGVNNINSEELRNLKIVLPSVLEQTQIVSEIESRLSVADNLEQTINQSLQQAEALRQSILKQAFEGRLVSTIKTKEAKLIPFERKVLAAHIIYLLNDQPHFGLTKFQKTLFVAEHHAEIEYPTYYDKEVAGPYDSFFTHRFREEMIDEDWFAEETKFLATHFIPGENVGSIIKDYAKCFREKGSKITHVLKLFKDKTLHESELIATLYASWNNRIIKTKEINEELLVQDLYKWSEEKKKYRKEEILSTYHWMIDVGLVPTGFGKYIDKK